MSSPDISKNITRIRTFRDDVARSRGKDDATLQIPEGEKSQPKITPKKVARINTEPRVANIEMTHVRAQQVTSSQTKKPVKYGVLTEEIAQVAKPHKESILSDSDSTYQSDIQVGGTIIRDTKRKRFQLIPAMITATVSWFNDIKKELVTSRLPEHTIAKAEARATVIQKATVNSEQAPKEDFKQVTEHLKKIERTAVSSTLTFKEKSEVPKPTWASATEIKAEEPTITSVVGVEQIDIPEVIPVTPQYEVKKEAVEIRVPVQNVVEPTEVIETEQEIEQQPVTMRTPERTDLSPKKYAPARNNDYVSFPIVTFMIVIIGASLLGIGASYYWFVLKDAPDTKAVTYTIPALVTAQSKVPFELPTDRITMLMQILTLAKQSTGVTQMYPTVPDENGIAKPAAIEDILKTLEPHAPGSFTRSIKEMAFGSTNNAQPFIIIKATSFDVAFAGMLDWEKTQSADLFPLFGQPVVETFDSSARTDTQVRSAFFKDTIASNKNVRLLVDEKGEDRIIYTFTDQNTILITTTRAALETLLPLVQ